MANTYKNKVIYDGNTLIDITDTTAVASDVAVGKYFYLASGEKVQGTSSGSGGGGKTGSYNIFSTNNGDGTQSLAIVDANGNGDYNITVTNNQDGTQSLAIVDAPAATINLQSKSKSYTPTESQQTEDVTYDSEYDGLDTVSITVGAISPSYVGSGITRRSSSDLTASGATVGVPAGYYSSSASKAVSSMTLPSSASASSSGTSKATITPTTSAQYLNIPTGYNDTAQYYMIAAASGGSANFATATMTNSSNQNTSISFTITSGRTVKAFFCRLTSQIARNSSSRYYYVYDMRWDGSSSGGVAGNQFYMYNGTLTNVTSGYSHEQSGTTFTLSSTGSRSASPGSFYNGTYELLYVY